jgi:hypothetical protein
MCSYIIVIGLRAYIFNKKMFRMKLFNSLFWFIMGLYIYNIDFIIQYLTSMRLGSPPLHPLVYPKAAVLNPDNFPIKDS